VSPPTFVLPFFSPLLSQKSSMSILFHTLAGFGEMGSPFSHFFFTASSLVHSQMLQRDYFKCFFFPPFLVPPVQDLFLQLVFGDVLSILTSFLKGEFTLSNFFSLLGHSPKLGVLNFWENPSAVLKCPRFVPCFSPKNSGVPG